MLDLNLEVPLPDVYILSAVRTPIGKFGGSLASMTAADMWIVAATAAIERAGIRTDQIEETIFGNARQAGGGPNVARQISIRSGVPQEVRERVFRRFRLEQIILGHEFASIPGLIVAPTFRLAIGNRARMPA